GTLQQAYAAIPISLLNPAKLLRHLQRHHGSRRYRFAVQPGAIALVRFDGMAEGMAEIERGANAGLPFISCHYRSLGGARTVDGLGKRLRIERKQPLHVRLEPSQKGLVADQSIF